MNRARTLAISAFVLVALVAIQAGAYQRTLTCQEGADPATNPMACREGQTPVPLYWNQDCAVYHIHEAGAYDIDDDSEFDAIRQSFATWETPACSYLTFIDGGFTNEDRVGYYTCDPKLNANIVIFRPENWTHQRQALALTSVTFNSATGQVVDADIEFNDEWFTFTTTDLTGLIRNDIRNTLTHEVGHFLGLDHSADPEATMYGRAPLAELDKRTLEQDDIDGLCAIYPLSEATGVCDTSSVGYCARAEEGPGDPCPDDSDNCNCALDGRRRSPATSFVMVFALSTILLWRRRNRRHSHSKG